MVNKILVFCFVIGFLTGQGESDYLPYPVETVIEQWLTDETESDFNDDGIVNFRDFTIAAGDCYEYYGCGEYGMYEYGN